MTYLEAAAASTRTEIQVRAEQNLLAIAVQWRKILWKQPARNEDDRLSQLVDVCTRLKDGDRTAGEHLATKALWTADIAS